MKLLLDKSLKKIKFGIATKIFEFNFIIDKCFVIQIEMKQKPLKNSKYLLLTTCNILEIPLLEEVVFLSI